MQLAHRLRLLDNGRMPGSHPVAKPATVTIYGAEWCGDCRRSRRLLEARGVAFDYVDVAAQPAVRRELAENGYPAIPVVVLPDGTILMEPSDERLAAALDAVEPTYSAPDSSSSSSRS